MCPTVPLARELFCALALLAAFGCSRAEPDSAAFVDPASIALVPVSGVITLNHKPLVGAVVAFMPSSGATSVGETDASGKYELESYGRKEGAPVGSYKVAISYLLSPEGEPQGLSARSSFTPTPGFITAKERLPKEYSDLGSTKLKAEVGPRGGQFDFNIELPGEPLDVKPATKSDSASKPELDQAPAKAPTDKAAPKPK